jgi:hypothetical protein
MQIYAATSSVFIKENANKNEDSRCVLFRVTRTSMRLVQ